MSRAPLTRRDFLARAAVAGSFAGLVPAIGAARAAASVTSVATPRMRAAASVTNVAAPRMRAVAPVVSFHLDRPYVDLSGEAIPYLPPAGARGAEALAGLSDADLFRLPL